MASLIENLHHKRLDKLGINIRTYYVSKDQVLVRNTDNSQNQPVIAGIRHKKEYFKDGKLLSSELNFDSRIAYTYVSTKNVLAESDESNADFTCPNCGVTGPIKAFADSCPYCGVNYNIDFNDNDNSDKKGYDPVYRNSFYKLIYLIVDLAISLLASTAFIRLTSRTFNSIDIGKCFIYAAIMTAILYLIFYVNDTRGKSLAYFYYTRKKEAKNEEQRAFWARSGINKKEFYNNYIYELSHYYYGNENNIIDFDIIDYDELKDYRKDNRNFIEIKAYIRLVSLINGKIKSSYVEESSTFMHLHERSIRLENGINIMRCPSCGASIDATSKECAYCGKPIGPLHSWSLVKTSH